MSDVMNKTIAFPILCILKEAAIELSKSDFQKLYYKGVNNDGNLIAKHGCSPNLRILAIVDRNGCWRDAEVVSKKRKWAELFWWLWDWVLVEYSFSSPKVFTAKEMLEHFMLVKAKPPFAKAGHLRGMLKRLPEDTIFNAELFRQFWDKHCPALKPHEWEEQLP